MLKTCTFSSFSFMIQTSPRSIKTLSLYYSFATRKLNVFPNYNLQITKSVQSVLQSLWPSTSATAIPQQQVSHFHWFSQELRYQDTLCHYFSHAAENKQANFPSVCSMQSSHTCPNSLQNRSEAWLNIFHPKTICKLNRVAEIFRTSASTRKTL